MAKPTGTLTTALASTSSIKALRDPIVFATAPNAVCIWATFALLPVHPRSAADVVISVQERRSVDQARSVTSNPAMGTGYVLRRAS
jgi:hypothetical protein